MVEKFGPDRASLARKIVCTATALLQAMNQPANHLTEMDVVEKLAVQQFKCVHCAAHMSFRFSVEVNAAALSCPPCRLLRDEDYEFAEFQALLKR